MGLKDIVDQDAMTSQAPDMRVMYDATIQQKNSQMARAVGKTLGYSDRQIAADQGRSRRIVTGVSIGITLAILGYGAYKAYEFVKDHPGLLNP